MQAETYPFVMRQLPYEVYALSPCISAESVLYHHDRIYKKYVDLLNQDLADYSYLQKKSMKELLSGIENLPGNLQESVRIHGGGAFAHELYFDSMLPLAYEQDPKGTLQEAVIRDFGSIRDLRDCMKHAALQILGVGYVWLTLGMDGIMRVNVTEDNGSPPLKTEIPLLVLDVWEHAYYLQYQNRLEEHLNAWARVVNWRKVTRRYEEALAEVEKKALLQSGGSMILHLCPGELQEPDPMNWGEEPGHMNMEWNEKQDGMNEDWGEEIGNQATEEDFSSEFAYIP